MTERYATTRRYLFDKVLLGYTFVMFVINFFSVTSGLDYLWAALANLFFFLIILKITYRPPRQGILAYLRWLYPLLFLVPLHFQIELVATIFHSGESFDPIVRSWDKALFGPYLHRELPLILRGSIWRELLHLAYALYYLLIVGGFAMVWWRGYSHATDADQLVSPEYLRFAFIFLGTFVSFMILYILFPVVGPLDDRFLRFHEIGFLPPVIDAIYRFGDSAGGAFPSSHEGQALVMLLLLKPTGRLKFALLILLSLSALGAIYGSFHYAIDTLFGLIAGVFFYMLWSRLYARWDEELPEGDPVVT